MSSHNSKYYVPSIKRNKIKSNDIRKLFNKRIRIDDEKSDSEESVSQEEVITYNILVILFYGDFLSYSNYSVILTDTYSKLSFIL